MDNRTSPDCKYAIELLDRCRSDAEEQALSAHLAVCAECRTQARIRRVMAELNEAVPAGLEASIMGEIRRQRQKQAARMRWIRRAGAMAAAAVLIPAVVLAAPIFFRMGAPLSMEEADRAVMDTPAAVQENAQVPEVFLDTAATEATAAGGSVPVTAATEAETKSAETGAETTPKLMYSVYVAPTGGDPIPPAEAPDYVRESGTVTEHAEKSPSLSTMAETTAAVTTAVPNRLTTAMPPSKNTDSIDDFAQRAVAVIRAIVGDGAVDGASASLSAPLELCRELDIRRDAFEAAADHLGIVFSAEELDALFT